MQSILVLGAGLSASSLIRYLLNNSTEQNWLVKIVDQDIEMVKGKIGGHPNGIALSFNALDAESRRPEIEKADLVISMLPAIFHVEVAKDCIELKTNLITPSYVSPEMKALDGAAKDAGIVIMNEIGVDPGIDHMSAMRIIDHIHAQKGEIKSFKSYCGGLVAPESDNNPWNYKFTWNPRNVVLAGQGAAASYIRDGRLKYIPYSQLFKRVSVHSIDGFGDFEGYANRDSLSYRQVYGLEKIPTIFRGTLRRKGYCGSWNLFVELGMTEDNYKIVDSETLTASTFLNTFLPPGIEYTTREKFAMYVNDDKELLEKFDFLDFFNDTEVLGIENASPAQLLQKILVAKWSLEPSDKDMLVMIHEFEYEIGGVKKELTSYMVNIGEDGIYTSMSNTVGLPVAICSKMILNGTMTRKGVQLPIHSDVYNPILNELEEFGITFIESEK